MAQQKYTYATGRRKSSSARVYLYPLESDATPEFIVNGKSAESYFGDERLITSAKRPLEVAEKAEDFLIKVRVRGGGVSGQAQAVSHGIARALQSVDSDLRVSLKKEGLLKRDPRVVERKKPGRHKARKKPQFSKR